MGAMLDFFGSTEKEYEPDPYSVYEHKQLRQEIAQLVSTISTNDNSTESYRILMCSGSNDGKSSLINNIMSALNSRYIRVAPTGQNPCHVTQKYFEYKMTINEKPTRFVLCDTNGLSASSDDETFYDTMHAAVMGQFSRGQDMINTSADDSDNEVPHRASNSTEIEEEPFKKSAVAIFFVISADKLKSKALQELQQSRQFQATIRIINFANSHGIPTAFFISKCDAWNKKIKDLYKSQKVKITRNRLHSSFNGFPLNRIFPIVNYTKHMMATPDMMIQTLYAMKHVMNDIHDYLNKATYRV